jgi:hypothetical protein
MNQLKIFFLLLLSLRRKFEWFTHRHPLIYNENKLNGFPLPIAVLACAKRGKGRESRQRFGAKLPMRRKSSPRVLISTDVNGSDTNGYHRYYIYFHIFYRIQIRTWIASDTNKIRITSVTNTNTCVSNTD